MGVEVLIRKGGSKKYKKVDWYTYSEEKWVTNDEGVPLWSEVITIDLTKAYKKATSKNTTKYSYSIRVEKLKLIYLL
ncbi:MAG: hypothetical protein HRT44_12415, partial [Bdellovibrionales bacterium]|nr:hypothetical protein [Bdellovibrionales bacterium]